MTTLPPIRILSPTAILGYGFPETSFAAGLALNPDVIAVDAGSTSIPAPISWRRRVLHQRAGREA